MNWVVIRTDGHRDVRVSDQIKLENGALIGFNLKDTSVIEKWMYAPSMWLRVYEEKDEF